MSDTDFASRGDQYLNRKLFEPAPRYSQDETGAGGVGQLYTVLVSWARGGFDGGIGEFRHRDSTLKVRNPLYRLPSGEKFMR